MTPAGLNTATETATSPTGRPTGSPTREGGLAEETTRLPEAETMANEFHIESNTSEDFSIISQDGCCHSYYPSEVEAQRVLGRLNRIAVHQRHERECCRTDY